MKQYEDMILGGHWRQAREQVLGELGLHPEAPEATVAAFVAALHGALDQFQARPVQELCRDIELELPEPLSLSIQADVVPRLERIGQWLELLNAVTGERLCREMLSRAVIGDVKLAAQSALELLGRASDPDQLRGHCRLVASALVELYTNRDRALTIIKLVASAGGTGTQAAPMLSEIYDTMAADFHQTALQSHNQAWVRNQNEAVLAFRSSLPGANEVGEPDPEQVERFRREVNALLNAGFYHRRPADLIDALTIMHEYCPVDPLPAVKRSIADTSERMFNRLGPRARLVAVRALAILGQSPQLVRAVLKLAEADRDGSRLAVFGAVMGGLRHEDFFPYLKTRLDKARTEREEEFAVDALGRVSSPAAVDLLIERLDKAVRKIHDPAFERRAHNLVRAVGRVARVRGFDPVRRVKIVDKVIDLINRAQDRHLAFHAAHDLFSVRLDELRPDQKNWAAARTVEALWGKPPGVPVALGYGMQDWRSPMVENLNRLGPGALASIMETAGKFSAQLSGAMDSLADVLAGIGDASAVPLLEQMAQTVLLHREDDAKNPLLDEKVFDAASGQLQELDRDNLLHSILYALRKIGGQPGLAVIVQIADDVQSGRISIPGDQTAQLLVDVRLKQGGGMAVKPVSFKDVAVDPKALKKALGEAQGGLFVKTPTRIAAVARLGGMRSLDAVPLLVKLLGEKEPMLASAAYTALSQYFQPLPVEADFSAILDAMLADCARLKSAGMERLLEFFRRQLPKRPPYDRLFMRQIEAQVEDPELAHRLKGSALAPGTGQPAQTPPAEETGAAGESPDAQPALTGRTLLDQRREYMLARKAWVEGGKVGPPPPPPDAA